MWVFGCWAASKAYPRWYLFLRYEESTSVHWLPNTNQRLLGHLQVLGLSYFLDTPQLPSRNHSSHFSSFPSHKSIALILISQHSQSDLLWTPDHFNFSCWDQFLILCVLWSREDALASYCTPIVLESFRCPLHPPGTYWQAIIEPSSFLFACLELLHNIYWQCSPCHRLSAVCLKEALFFLVPA